MLPACVSLIRSFLAKHVPALCAALDAAGAADIARLLQGAAGQLPSDAPHSASAEEQSPQVAFVRQRCWLELHHGVYRHVAVVWRDVYLATSLLLAARAACAAPPAAAALQSALKAIDAALLFGAMLGRSIAEDVYEEIQQLLRDGDAPAGESAKRHKACAGDSSVPPPPDVFGVRLTEEQLPALTRPMPRLPPPSLLQFRDRYLLPLLPVVLQSLAEHWPATTRWRDLSYLEAAAGTRTVPVELGDHYLAHNWRQQLMPVSQFIKEHMAPASRVATGYVAQHDLFSQVKRLRADITVPDYVCASAHAAAVAGECPAAAAALLAHIRADSPYHLYHCCSSAPAPAPHHRKADDDIDHPTPPFFPPPAEMKPKVPRECVSPTPPEASDAGDGGDCSVRMHAWFGPAGSANPTTPPLPPPTPFFRRHCVAAAS